MQMKKRRSKVEPKNREQDIQERKYQQLKRIIITGVLGSGKRKLFTEIDKWQ